MYPVTAWSCQTELSGESASAAALAREFVRVRLGEHGFADRVEDVALIATELASNVVLHAETPFTVTLQGDHESVLLTVRDGSALPPVVPDTHVMATHGRGLAIVAALSDRWGTRPTDGGKSVWAWFDKHPLP